MVTRMIFGSIDTYYVNKNTRPGGIHPVHRSDCDQGAYPENRVYVGSFYSLGDAVWAAGDHYEKVRACRNCCDENGNDMQTEGDSG